MFFISMAAPKDLEPGQAQTSKRVMPSSAQSASTQSWEASSCTKNNPSSKPGKAVTGTPETAIPTGLSGAKAALAPTAFSCSISPFRVVNRVLTRRSTGGCLQKAASRDSVRSSPKSSKKRRQIEGEKEYFTERWDTGSSSRLGRGIFLSARKNARKMALTKPLVFLGAKETVSLTAA